MTAFESPQPLPVPPSVRRAVTLYRIDLTIGLVGTVVLTGAFLTTTLSGHAPERVRTLAVAGAVVGVVIGLAVAGLKLFLASRVRAGRRWSRVAILALTAVGALGLVTEVSAVLREQVTGYQWAALALGVVGAALSVWTLVLLFGQTPDAWWRARR